MCFGRPPWLARCPTPPLLFSSPLSRPVLSNKLELATKIKNIELTFPEESIDPHLKVSEPFAESFSMSG